MLRFTRRWSNQRGNSTTGVLVFASALALASGAVIQTVRNNAKAKSQESATDIERKVNETALQSVTQLVTNGLLFFNSADGCKVIEPQIQGMSVPKYVRTNCLNITPTTAALNCASEPTTGTPSWRFKRTCPSSKCEVVDVCVPISEKNKVTGLIETKNVLVEVKFVDYKNEPSGSGDAKKVYRNFAYLKAQRPRAADGRYFSSSLEARVNLGASLDGNRGLLGRYGAADTCFYMRPKTVEQGAAGTLGFSARSSGRSGQNYLIEELEPRPDGRLSDEFQRELPNLASSARAEDDAVLEPLRNSLISNKYLAGFRGARPIPETESATADVFIPNAANKYVSENRVVQVEAFRANEQADQYFVGVMPQLAGNKGPEFQYFLTRDKLQPRQWMKRNPPPAGQRSPPELNAGEWQTQYRGGCGSAGQRGAGADFCTKVYVPRQYQQARFQTKCAERTVTVTIPPVAVGETPQKKYVNRAVQVTCSRAWVERVRDIMNDEQARLNNTSDMFRTRINNLNAETGLQMAVAALEVDDAFVEGNGRWRSNPIRVVNSAYPTLVTLRAGDPTIHPLRAAYDGFQSELEGQPNVRRSGNFAFELEGAADATRNPDTGALEGGTPRTFQVRVLESLPNPEMAERYESKTCAYFIYRNAADPRKCSYDFVTSDEAGFVCRNNDGCFDESTFIRMADGSDRKITHLKKGEFVFNPVTQLPAKIVKLTIGPEMKHLLNVKVGQRMVKVTDTHPFMTRRGWVQAKDLRKGEEILNGKNSFDAVQSVELGEFGRTVVNLALEGPANQPELHYVLADGVVTGDLVIQNMLQMKASNR